MRPRKLLWTEGLFVTQHHFQQLDRYHEALVGERVRAVSTYDWGVTDVEVDERALAAGQLRIDVLRAVLPDGTPLAIGPGLEDVAPTRAIDLGGFPAGQSVDVLVGLYEERQNAPNVEVDVRPDSIARYGRDQVAVVDYNGGAERELVVARRNVRVLLGSEVDDAFVGVRVARLARGPGGKLQLEPAFVPPVLRVGASQYLVAGFRRLLSTMIGKQRTLAARRQQRTEAAVDFEPGDMVKFWLLHTLNENIPRMAHVVEHGASHPEGAYLALASLIGQLCTFAVDGDPSTVPRFDFLDLGKTFTPMFDRAMFLLDAVVAERYLEIALTKRDDGMYLGQFDAPEVLQYEYFLAIEAPGVPDSSLREKIPRLTKIASWGQITSILNSAIPGCKLELEYRPPGALPLRPGILFFRVHRTADFWTDVATTASIAIYQPINPDAVQLHLYAVDPASLK
jgi:type VI secretion system protein ImpJ